MKLREELQVAAIALLYEILQMAQHASWMAVDGTPGEFSIAWVVSRLVEQTSVVILTFV